MHSGLDVALIAGGHDIEQLRSQGGRSEERVPVQALGHFRPLAVMQALDVETQLRTTDAVVPWERGRG